MDKFTTEKIKEEIEKTNNIIKEMTGETPAFFRPPYIAVNNDMYDVIDLPFICGIDCADWDGAVSADKRAKTILGKVKDGDIILLHDFSGNQNTVKALDAIIEGLQDDGFTLVTVSQLFEQKGVEPDAENELWTNAGQ